MPVDESWMAAYRLGIQPGGIVITELRVFPREQTAARPPGLWSARTRGIDAIAPPGGITARLLRSVPLAEHYQFDKEFHSLGRTRAIWSPKKADSRSSPAKVPLRRRGPKGRPDEFYAKIARHYAEAVRSGTTRPVAETAKKLNLKEPQVRDFVHQARRRGLLSKTRQGRVGGLLTEKAERLLSKTAVKQ